MSELEAVNAGAATQATLKIEIGPLIDATYGVLVQSLDGSALGALLPADVNGPQVGIDTGFPAEDSIPATTIASWLAVAGHWIWFAVGAVIMAGAALVVARRGNRGGLLAGAGVLILIAAGTLALWTGSWDNADAAAQTLPDAVAHVVLEGLGVRAMALAGGLATGGGIAVVAGLGWFWLGRRGASAQKA
ncbi:hypothetical protein [Paeniglutamicibacter cryotolerans]|uniref:Uncharacterized protein n=1 Tax=Paeniglutamicibacter cryotolerans TaxID=670079 RepID=A0A839QD53_9MICC|nr:hypothetical protein [Paeniglutamicibacter cryotolerans]MBB2993830.1 hypothetical protein [Paeniglutamicibacter cryotolerans]